MLGNKDGSTLTYIDRLGLLLKAEGKLAPPALTLKGGGVHAGGLKLNHPHPP